jgi:hypothetical protein
MEQTRRRSRKTALTTEILGQMRLYALKRADLLLSKAILDYYRCVINYAPEYVREMNFCRQRLDLVLGQFVEKTPAHIEAYMGPSKAILPPGCKTIDEAAEQLAQKLAPPDLQELDSRVQVQINRQFKTLSAFCLDKTDQTPAMAELILGQFRAFLEPSFEGTNSAAIYFQSADTQIAYRDLMDAFDDAIPDLTPQKKKPEQMLCLISVPEGEAGQRFLQIVEENLGGERVCAVTGGEDIIVYREHGLRPADMPQLGPLARETCRQVVQAEATSAHARCDINWQVAVKD